MESWSTIANLISIEPASQGLSLDIYYNQHHMKFPASWPHFIRFGENLGCKLGNQCMACILPPKWFPPMDLVSSEQAHQALSLHVFFD